MTLKQLTSVILSQFALPVFLFHNVLLSVKDYEANKEGGIYEILFLKKIRIQEAFDQVFPLLY